MPNYTENLNLEKPLGNEQYNIAVFNANADKIDQFAGQVPPRALTADKLTTGAKINGVNFKGDTDIVTGAGFYYDTVTYGAGDLAFIYNQNNALELHKSLSAGNIGHNPLTSTGYWEKVELGGSGGRNVGEIIQSTIPLTDAGLHLLDGARLSGDGIYKRFVDYIAELYTENPNANYFCTEAQWQATVTLSVTGSCGKFVYDSTLNTVRLPKINGIIQGTTAISVLGDLVEAGLPVLNTNTTGAHTHERGTMNITGGFRLGDNSDSNYWARCWATSGAFSGTKQSHIFGNYDDGSTENAIGNVSFDASRSWTGATSSNGDHTHTASWTGHTSSTVQPETTKVFVYIVIANSTKTQIEVDIDEIATDLNGKADVDLSNITATSSTNFDGQWVKSYLEIFTQKYWNVGNTQETYDLSSYLPNDGYAYEVLLSADGNTGATAGASAEFFVGSAFCDEDSPVIWRARTRTNGDDCAGGMAILPIGADRKIYAKMVVTTATTSATYFYALAYRRIGTNS